MRILTLTLNPCVDRTIWVEEFDLPAVKIDRQSGGKGINVARVLSNLGEDCVAIAPVGGDGGREFEELARAEGVRLVSVPVSGNTRTIDTYTRISDYEQRVVRQAGPELTDADEARLHEAVTTQLPFCSVLAVCGSASCQRGAAFIRRIIEEAKSIGVKTLLDSNGEALEQGAAAFPDVLKVNEAELAQLIGPSDDPMHQEASRLTTESPIGRVILTLGERGCAQYQGEQVAFCPAPKVECVNAVGSGDSFTAAWLHAQIRGFSDDGALLLACAAGAANAAMFPAARITRQDIEKITGFQWL